jgi:hypothetical protein
MMGDSPDLMSGCRVEACRLGLRVGESQPNARGPAAAPRFLFGGLSSTPSIPYKHDLPFFADSTSPDPPLLLSAAVRSVLPSLPPVFLAHRRALYLRVPGYPGYVNLQPPDLADSVRADLLSMITRAPVALVARAVLAVVCTALLLGVGAGSRHTLVLQLRWVAGAGRVRCSLYTVLPMSRPLAPTWSVR